MCNLELAFKPVVGRLSRRASRNSSEVAASDKSVGSAPGSGIMAGGADAQKARGTGLQRHGAQPILRQLP